MGSSGPGRVRVERGIYRQPNGKYAVCCRHAGRLHFRTVGSNLAEARRERLALIAATREGSVPVSPRLRFETVAGWWLERFEAKVAAGERHPRTLEAHRYQLDRHLLPAFGRRRIAALTVDDVAELLHQLRRAGCSAKTAAGALATLQSVLRFARRCGWIVADPVERLEHDERPRPTRRRQRVLGRAEIERLLGACAPRERLMIATVLYTGLRISEMLGLVWDDVDFAAGVIHVRAQLSRAHRGLPARRVPPKTPASCVTSRSSRSSPACSAHTGSGAGSRAARTGCSRPAAAPPTATATSATAASGGPPSSPGSTTTAGRRFASTTCATPSPAT
jgi:Phage integrase family/Phage integrase, N-terminal SAM-like domain